MASRSWNHVELLGNLTRDPELRYTPSGTAVCTFGLATNRTYVSDGERKEDVDFHQIVAWAKLAELCNQLLKKGSKVFVSGRLQYREWDTPEGQKRRVAEIVIEDMITLTSRGEAGEMVQETERPASQEVDHKPAKEELKPVSDAPTEAADESVSDDDLPF